MKPCACGCGQIVKRTYAPGHFARCCSAAWHKAQGDKLRGRKQSEESNQKRRITCLQVLNTEEMHEKLSAAHTGEKHWNFGNSYSGAFKKKLSDAHLGQAAWNKGRSPSEETREKIRQARIGTHRSEASKLKQRLTILRKGKSIGYAGKRKYWAERNYRSNPEIAAEEILKNMGLDFISSCKIDFIAHAYTADFYLPKYNTVVEIDGRYYHSEEHFPKRVWFDRLREQELKEKGYNVLRFWEDELSLIKARLISVLGLADKSSIAI